MSMKGNQLTSLQEVSGSPETVFTASGKTLLRKYACAYSLVESLLPAIGSPDSDFSDLVVSRASYIRDGDAAMVTVEYAAPDLQTTIAPDSSAVLDASANAMELPVEDILARYGASASTVTTLKENGVQSYLFPQPTVRRTRRVTGFTYTQANITKNVGYRVAPPGITGAAANYWLKVGRDVRDVGVNSAGQRVTEIVDSYQYDPDGWNTDLYPNTGTD